jgi:hypothetical protein
MCDGNEDINFLLIYVETRENVEFFLLFFLIFSHANSTQKYIYKVKVKKVVHIHAEIRRIYKYFRYL